MAHLDFSDSPETVKQDGILYNDVVEGKSRILYYHLNGTMDDKKVVVILENMSADDSFCFHYSWWYRWPE